MGEYDGGICVQGPQADSISAAADAITAILTSGKQNGSDTSTVEVALEVLSRLVGPPSNISITGNTFFHGEKK
jgi:hypothetical protein